MHRELSLCSMNGMRVLLERYRMISLQDINLGRLRTVYLNLTRMSHLIIRIIPYVVSIVDQEKFKVN